MGNIKLNYPNMACDKLCGCLKSWFHDWPCCKQHNSICNCCGSIYMCTFTLGLFWTVCLVLYCVRIVMYYSNTSDVKEAFSAIGDAFSAEGATKEFKIIFLFVFLLCLLVRTTIFWLMWCCKKNGGGAKLWFYWVWL